MQNISQLSVLDSGSDIWIIPEEHLSYWARKIDWYLNLQIYRTAYIYKNEPDSHSKIPLAIMSQQRFPNKQVIQMPFDEPKKWVHNIFNLWNRFQRPSLRVFLPQNITDSFFKKLWPEGSQNKLITLVCDPQ